MPVDPIASITPITRLAGLTHSAETGTTPSALDNFGQLLNQALDHLNQKEQVANQATADLAAGKDIEVHQVMLAVQEADLTFQLALQMRNKLVEAYQEIMRMQV